MKRIAILFTFLFCSIYQVSKAQVDNTEEGKFFIGINAGATYSNISRLNTVILSEPYFTGYRLWDSWTVRYPHIGGFVRYNLPGSGFFVHAELGFADQGGHLHFVNDKQLYYNMNFNYQYINAVPMVGYHFSNWFHAALGLQYGFNVTEDQLYYSSDYSPGYMGGFGTDGEQQQQLRNVLKGKNDFGFTASIGGALPLIEGLGWEARGHLGTKNVLDVADNSYNFDRTQSCRTYTGEFMFTYQIPFPHHN